MATLVAYDSLLSRGDWSGVGMFPDVTDEAL